MQVRVKFRHSWPVYKKVAVGVGTASNSLGVKFVDLDLF